MGGSARSPPAVDKQNPGPSGSGPPPRTPPGDAVMVPVCVGRRAQGIGVDSVHAHVAVRGRAGPSGSGCAPRCSAPPPGRLGAPHAEPTGGIRARAPQPPGHKDMQPGRPTAQVVLPEGPGLASHGLCVPSRWLRVPRAC